jgi:DNA-binding LacI/PurR family transcriptional regulator
VVVPSVHRWFFAEVINSVDAALRDAGFDLLLYNLRDEAGRTRFFDVMPLRKRVDAVLVVSLLLSEDEVTALQSLNCPLGLMGLAAKGFHSSRIDDVAAAHTAVQYLLSLGHTRIGLIGADSHDPMRSTSAVDRRVGYHAALREAGAEIDPALQLLGHYRLDGGRTAALQLLSLPDPPTAIFAESDEMAYGALRAIRGRKLRVPQDIALMGFDDHTIAEVMDLTTIRQPVADQASDVTTRLLIDIAEGGGMPDDDVVLPTELIIRGSTETARSVY